jgi:DNA modification methylase
LFVAVVVAMSTAPSAVTVSAVRQTPLSALRAWPENPRRIRPARFDDLKRAMVAERAMLEAKPLWALPDGVVFAGNQRLRAALELGWDAIPVVTVTGLSPEQVKTWALLDNNAFGDWDEPALAELLAELEASGLDLALTGFENRELDRLLAGFAPERDPDEAPPLPAGEPESRPGEIYELGSHRLLCGDATDPTQVAQLMAGATAEVIWTDPPYGVRYVGKTRQALTITNDCADGLAAPLGRAFAAVDAVFAPSGRFYVAAPAGPQGTLFRLALNEVGWRFHQALVWVKNSPVLGHSDYHYAHEDVLYGWKPGHGRAGRGGHAGSRWHGGNAATSVFFVDRPARSSEHPTMKPVALISAMLENSSRRGDLVLDPFAGSGSTLIACEQLGRRCYAIELDPGYCDVIRRRYQEYSNGE